MEVNSTERILQSLKKFGLMPEVKEDRIIFYYQMALYIYVPDSKDENYVAMTIPNICDVTAENQTEVLNAINASNAIMKSAKMVIADNKVWALWEQFLPEEGCLDSIVRRGITCLHEITQYFEAVRTDINNK